MLSASLVVSEEAEIKQFRYILKSVQYDKVEDPNAEFFNRLSRYIEARKRIFAECGRDWCQEWWTFWKSSHPHLESTYPELLSALDEDLVAKFSSQKIVIFPLKKKKTKKRSLLHLMSKMMSTSVSCKQE